MFVNLIRWMRSGVFFVNCSESEVNRQPVRQTPHITPTPSPAQMMSGCRVRSHANSWPQSSKPKQQTKWQKWHWQGSSSNSVRLCGPYRNPWNSHPCSTNKFSRVRNLCSCKGRWLKVTKKCHWCHIYCKKCISDMQLIEESTNRTWSLGRYLAYFIYGLFAISLS